MIIYIYIPHVIISCSGACVSDVVFQVGFRPTKRKISAYKCSPARVREGRFLDGWAGRPRRCRCVVSPIQRYDSGHKPSFSDVRIPVVFRRRNVVVFRRSTISGSRCPTTFFRRNMHAKNTTKMVGVVLPRVYNII